MKTSLFKNGLVNIWYLTSVSEKTKGGGPQLFTADPISLLRLAGQFLIDCFISCHISTSCFPPIHHPNCTPGALESIQRNWFHRTKFKLEEFGRTAICWQRKHAGIITCYNKWGSAIPTHQLLMSITAWITSWSSIIQEIRKSFLEICNLWVIQSH